MRKQILTKIERYGVLLMDQGQFLFVGRKLRLRFKRDLDINGLLDVLEYVKGASR